MECICLVLTTMSHQIPNVVVLSNALIHLCITGIDSLGESTAINRDLVSGSIRMSTAFSIGPNSAMQNINPGMVSIYQESRAVLRALRLLHRAAAAAPGLRAVQSY